MTVTDQMVDDFDAIKTRQRAARRILGIETLDVRRHVNARRDAERETLRRQKREGGQGWRGW